MDATATRPADPDVEVLDANDRRLTIGAALEGGGVVVELFGADVDSHPCVVVDSDGVREEFSAMPRGWMEPARCDDLWLA